MNTQMRERIEHKQSDIEHYINHNRFFQLFLKTRKYKELVCSKEASLSFIISVILYIFLGYTEDSIGLIRTLLMTNIASMVGLLGFIISGLSILSATVSTKVIDSINQKGKIGHFMRIMFSFYYAGSLIGFSLIASVFTYIGTHFNVKINPELVNIWSFLLSYILIFTIISCIMLLGTSMRFFLLNYWYYREEKNNNK